MRVLDVIVCDEVRREMGNKLSLMGVYGDEMRLETTPDGPFALRLAVFVRAMLEAGDPFPDRMDFVVHSGGQEIAQGGSTVAATDPARPIGILIALNPVVFPALGEATFELKLTHEGAPVGMPIHYSLNIAAGPATPPVPPVH